MYRKRATESMKEEAAAPAWIVMCNLRDFIFFPLDLFWFVHTMQMQFAVLMVCYVCMQPQFVFLWAPPETKYGNFLLTHSQFIKSSPTWCGDARRGSGPRLAIVVLLGVGLQQLEPVPQTLPEIGQILSSAALCGGRRDKRWSMLQLFMLLSWRFLCV